MASKGLTLPPDYTLKYLMGQNIDPMSGTRLDPQNAMDKYNQEVWALNPDVFTSEGDPIQQSLSPLTLPQAKNSVPRPSVSRPGSTVGYLKGNDSIASNAGGTVRADGLVRNAGLLNSTANAGGYEIPKRDESRVSYLTQKAAAPGLRALRNQMGQAMGQEFENSFQKRMTLRDALSGYGQGLESVLGGAAKTGEAQYQTEYQPMLTRNRDVWSIGQQRAESRDRIAAQERMQGSQIASQQKMQSEQIAAQQQMNEFNNLWKEYLLSTR